MSNHLMQLWCALQGNEISCLNPSSPLNLWEELLLLREKFSVIKLANKIKAKLLSRLSTNFIKALSSIECQKKEEEKYGSQFDKMMLIKRDLMLWKYHYSSISSFLFLSRHWRLNSQSLNEINNFNRHFRPHRLCWRKICKSLNDEHKISRIVTQMIDELWFLLSTKYTNH